MFKFSNQLPENIALHGAVNTDAGRRIVRDCSWCVAPDGTQQLWLELTGHAPVPYSDALIVRAGALPGFVRVEGPVLWGERGMIIEDLFYKTDKLTGTPSQSELFVTLSDPYDIRTLRFDDEDISEPPRVHVLHSRGRQKGLER